ncbi:MAG TPA: M1 family metallopeptidase [Acidimicrobiales bacterium]|nr:M1 family metallopeptidase [Acidimicrobiales bacterium]
MAADPAPAPPDLDHRLPRTAEPTVYRLTLAPDLEAATFSGQVSIELVVHRSTDRLVCNAAELSVTDAVLEPEGGPTVPATVTVDEGAERATFAFDTAVPPGRATLRCSFTGVLNDKLRGFYRSTFTDDRGATHTIATTQMESTDARRAFPCWDEPDRKAVFEVTLVVDPELAAFSNSAVVDEQVRPPDDPWAGRRAVRFAPTMKMSTYLVAFVVGPLEVTDPVDVDGVPVRVVHAPGKAGLTGYALEVAAHALRFFSDYFAIPYPADKLDLVAIPDFAFGAMENLGCVTFRETALLVDPEKAARTELERIADVVSHEIAHMWFGDLVTMRWWEGIWLNEAFATFMEVLCVDAFRPAWRRWVSFGLEREAALAVDGLHTTRPIEYPVGSPEEADGMFDVLTYQKGGSVLRMLEQYLGPEVFRDGVRRYLTEHAYANTVTSDLWQALEDVSSQPVRETMDSWILQGGYPLVTLDGDTLDQSPFAYTAPLPGEESAIGERWRVPVLLRPAAGATTERLLLGVEPAEVPGGTIVNAGGWGVYRVAYEDGPGAAGRFGDLDPLERSNLMADTWALVLAGRTGLDRLLALAANLGQEQEPGIYSIVTGAFGLCDRVVTDGDRPALERAVQALLWPRAADLGWEPVPGEGERVPTLRSLLLAGLGTIGADPQVRAGAAGRFDRSDTQPIDPDLEGAVLQTVAAQLRPGDYEAMLERYRNPSTPQEELRYLMALAAFPDVDLALSTFELARTEVRTQNAPYLVASLLGNRVGGPAVWARVEEEWDSLLERFPVNSHSRMLDGARALCGDPAVAADVAQFLDGHPLRSGQRSVAQMLERLRTNVAFGERVRPTLGTVLSGVVAAPTR